MKIYILTKWLWQNVKTEKEILRTIIVITIYIIFKYMTSKQYTFIKT